MAGAVAAEAERRVDDLPKQRVFEIHHFLRDQIGEIEHPLSGGGASRECGAEERSLQLHITGCTQSEEATNVDRAADDDGALGLLQGANRRPG